MHRFYNSMEVGNVLSLPQDCLKDHKDASEIASLEKLMKKVLATNLIFFREGCRIKSITLALCIIATLGLTVPTNTRADFAAALTGATVSPPGPSGHSKVDITMLVMASESGEADIHIATGPLPELFFDSTAPAVETVLNIEARDFGDVPPMVDFQGVSWQLLDQAGQPGNMTDDYFFSSLDSPQELTNIFADLVYNTGLTLEEATWSGGLLPSTDPATVATLQSVIFLDPAININAGGGLDLSMRVRLEAASSAAVPEPAAMLLAILGLTLLPRRRRR